MHRRRRKLQTPRSAMLRRRRAPRVRASEPMVRLEIVQGKAVPRPPALRAAPAVAGPLCLGQFRGEPSVPKPEPVALFSFATSPIGASAASDVFGASHASGAVVRGSVAPSAPAPQPKPNVSASHELAAAIRAQ